MSHITATSSGSLSASSVIAARPSRLCSIILVPAAAIATLTIYDNPSAASGKILAVLGAAANGQPGQLIFSVTVEADAGIYASLSGAGATYIVHHSLL